MPVVTVSFATELSHEHVSLLDQLIRLEEAVAPPASDVVGSLLNCLRDVQTNLRRHFAFEERGGYMSQLLDDAPYLYHAAQALLAEHGRMSADLDSLIAATDNVGRVTPGLRVQVRQWVQLVRGHEARENRLIQRACSEDIGAED